MNLRLPTLATSHLIFALGAMSGLMLGGALIGQYGFDLYPCTLCIYQRWPHGVIAALALLTYFSKPAARTATIVLWLVLALLVAGAGIAAYHAGVEAGIFAGPSGCSAEPVMNASLEALRAEIAGAALVSCAQAMAYIFGLSMAVWNMLISLAAVALVLVAKLKN